MRREDLGDKASDIWDRIWYNRLFEYFRNSSGPAIIALVGVIFLVLGLVLILFTVGVELIFAILAWQVLEILLFSLTVLLAGSGLIILAGWLS